MTNSGLLIASGLSSRINGFKPLLQYKDKSFLITIVNKLLSVLPKIVIVVGYNHGQLLDELNKNFNGKLKQTSNESWIIDDSIKIIYNKNFNEGMFSSLQLGVKELSDSDWILYHFVDQPNIPKEFYRHFIEQQTKSYNWVQPLFKGVKGHPILFDKSVSKKINNAEASSNLREILKDESIKQFFWECDFPQILEDIDTDEDYQKFIVKDRIKQHNY